MTFAELLFLALGLSMDAFAVSVCKGLGLRKRNMGQMGITGLYFGGFQALMPALGYWLGSRFEQIAKSTDHWVAFFLLAVIGGNMIWEAREPEENPGEDFSPQTMIPLAVATSIDALAIGFTFSFLRVPLLPAVSTIGIVTFAVTAVGVRLGNIMGDCFRARAQVAGGIVLLVMGIRILLSHLL